MPGWSRTGVVYRAYEVDGTPLYLGAETFEAARQMVLDAHSNVTVEKEGIMKTKLHPTAEALIEAMSQDNDVNYKDEITEEQAKALNAAVARLSVNLAFTSEVVDLIATGEQGEAQKLFGRIDGYKELDQVLDDIHGG
jgi:hypothetical protein